MYKAIRGTKDILPNEIGRWQLLEDTARKICANYGYKEIRTPVFEKTEVFSRGVGDGTDIVNKEMYSFEDRGGESLTLRPEQTASLVRAVIQNNLLAENPILRLFYIGSYYRYERPQKGRLREFHQFGIECIGSNNPESDAEVILLAINFINELGIKDYKLQINSLGNANSRENYRNALYDYLNSRKNELSNESQLRLEINPLRILDSKAENDISIVKDAPNILEYLDEESKIHFEQVKHLLDISNVNYVINSSLVRGLDYYSHTVFEFQSTHLGSQDAFGGGGRYNSLFSQLGGKDTPAVGFAMGIERLLLILEQVNANFNKEQSIFAMVIPTDFKYLDLATKLCEQIRYDLKQVCIMDLNRRSMKAQLREANKLSVEIVLIIGDLEAENESVTIKYMKENKEQKTIKISDIYTYFKQNLEF